MRIEPVCGERAPVPQARNAEQGAIEATGLAPPSELEVALLST
jgi:hypothetical protein